VPTAKPTPKPTTAVPTAEPTSAPTPDCAMYLSGPFAASERKQVATVDASQNYELAFTMELASDWSIWPPAHNSYNFMSILRIGAHPVRIIELWFPRGLNQMWIDNSGLRSTGVTFAAGQTYEIKVFVADNLMTLYVDGVSVGTASDNQLGTVVADAPVYVGGLEWNYQAAKATLSDICYKEIAAPTP
jgi:hypothetical protein